MKYLITGGSGYIGTRLTEFLIARENTKRIVLADVRPPRYPRAKVEFHRCDVRDRAGMRGLLERERPDALIHLAFVLNPIHDEAAMYDIDVNGTLNTLDAAAAAGTPQVLVTSSTTAYGAWPDNPRPIGEDWVLRGQPAFAYARHKTEVDRLCQLWAAQHPDSVMTIVRPCIVLGPSVENYIVRTWDQPVFWRFRGRPDRETQFVHEDDLAEAISGLLLGRHGGAFNVTGDGTVTWTQAARIAGMKLRTGPLGALRRLNGLLWTLHAGTVETPPGNLEFIVHPWVCSNEKVKRTLGWTPRHTTLETFELTMRARGRLEGPAAQAAGTVARPSGNGHGTKAPATLA